MYVFIYKYIFFFSLDHLLACTYVHIYAYLSTQVSIYLHIRPYPCAKAINKLSDYRNKKILLLKNSTDNSFMKGVSSA